MAAEVLKFTAGGLVAMLILGIATAVLVRRASIDEAVRNARDIVGADAHGVVEPNLTPEVVGGDPAALQAFDRTLRRLVLHKPLVRIKLWSPDGRIVYSDEARLIGNQYTLDDELEDALNDGGTSAGVTHLSKPEEHFERPHKKLLEVYTVVSSTDRKPMVFEGYLQFDSVTENGYRIWRKLLPVFLGALAFLQVLQMPLAWSLVRRLRDVQRDRESLLLRAIEASDTERRRIASDLHDTVVQNLAGVSFSLTAATEAAASNGDVNLAQTIALAASSTRDSMRTLRKLLVEIDPPALHGQGLNAALSDHLAPLAAHGVETVLDVPPDLDITSDQERLLFRVGREALRNIAKHAHPKHVTLRVTTTSSLITLTVEDDGQGFDTGVIEGRVQEGHVGLRLLSELAGDAGGELFITSAPGRGTTITLEVPTR
jgi:signal transduction histidine kinase